jgi:O-methyltransferase
MPLVRQALRKITNNVKLLRAIGIYRRYRTFSMLPWHVFASNIVLCQEKAPATGCIVEAGVWRGGMSAGIADAVPGRLHYLFDSFEGLPPAKEIDGKAALEWQKDVTGPSFFDNCRAEQAFAEQAMATAKAKEVHIIQGWFNETLKGFVPQEPIAVLRLDADWYDSTMQCLTSLYPHVVEGGVIILDDYYTWDGCALALHDYLSTQKRADRIQQWHGGVCYLIKRSDTFSPKCCENVMCPP